MAAKEVPLKEVSIEELFNGSTKQTYEIPIYQRNYAWEKDEITTLVQDVYDSYLKKDESPYYIGTLVSYYKGDNVYEVIDGQQRLTTICLLLDALEIGYTNELTYRARRKSDDTLRKLKPESNYTPDELDPGIEAGYKFAKAAVEDLIASDLDGFKAYFTHNVHLIHYNVPKDIDLNHYFEIMNSRGEQLEKHEIVKARLLQKLGHEEKLIFNSIWEACSEMSIYIQQNLGKKEVERIFGTTYDSFLSSSFDDIAEALRGSGENLNDIEKKVTIADIIDTDKDRRSEKENEKERKDSFQPIINFPNFLLIVLKLTQISKPDFKEDFTLDDKELINEFDDAKLDADGVKRFAYNLLRARFLLDNFVVHHTIEDDTIDSNPWKLQAWHKNEDTKKGQLRNLVAADEDSTQARLVNVLSMFEVSFTARQRKKYLFYSLMYLMDRDRIDTSEYADFMENLADRYFHEVYLDSDMLAENNNPLPRSFDDAMLRDHRLCAEEINRKDKMAFVEIYGDGTEASKGIPLFIFNYLDYKIWTIYMKELRGDSSRDSKKQEVFDRFGCSNIDLEYFKRFYFSRTRRSLEHYYPQAAVEREGSPLDRNQINCLGNYAMIGSAANSSGSDWDPLTKRTHYWDDKSGKINKISVASLKFMIMMQLCEDESKWEFDEIRKHQNKMLSILMGDTPVHASKDDPSAEKNSFSIDVYIE